MITNYYVIKLFLNHDDTTPQFKQVVECEEGLINRIADDLKRRLICSRVEIKKLN